MPDLSQPFRPAQAVEESSGCLVKWNHHHPGEQFLGSYQQVLCAQNLGRCRRLEQVVVAAPQDLEFGDDGRAYVRVVEIAQTLGNTEMPGVEVGEGIGVQQ